MESIEKLRDKISLDVNNPWSDLKGDLLAMVDKIEREIAERYMELPLDADGEPIHVGDEMESDNERFVVCAVALGRVHRWHVHNIGELDKGTVAYPPGSLHHHKPRTIEDVLNDCFRNSAGITTEEREELVAKYAAELRGMMGGDAE